jgi:hypothetical protein
MALIVNAITEALAGLRAIIGASILALQMRITRADVEHKAVDDDH